MGNNLSREAVVQREKNGWARGVRSFVRKKTRVGPREIPSYYSARIVPRYRVTVVPRLMRASKSLRREITLRWLRHYPFRTVHAIARGEAPREREGEREG